MKIFISNYDSESISQADIKQRLEGCLNILGVFSAFLKQKKLDSDMWKERLFSSLICKYSKLELSFEVVALLKNHPLYMTDKKLVEALTSAFFILLDFKNCPTDLGVQNFRSTAIIRNFLHLKYHMAKSLEVILDKKAAMALWREFVDFRTHQSTLPNAERPEDVLLVNSNGVDPIFNGGFDKTEYVLSDGRAGVKVKRCKWNEILRECEDVDYAYSIACHYDFEAYKKRNPHFKLTRRHTLTTGASFCDFCIHDTRKHNVDEHPDEIFWKKL